MTARALPRRDPRRRHRRRRRQAPARHPRRPRKPPQPARAAAARPRTIPGQPADYAPFVGPICSEDGKAAIVTAYIKAEGEGERIVDPVKFWRDEIADPGGGLEVKITGGAGFSADAIEVFEGINGTLLLAALSLVIFLLIVIYRSPMFFFIPLIAVIFAEIALALDRLRGLRARGDDQRPVELDHVGPRARRRHRLRAAARRPLPRGAPPHRRQVPGDAHRARIGRPGDLRLGADRDRRPALPDDRQGQRHLRPRPDRRDRHRLRGALDADPAAGAADDLRPPRLLALRPAHAGDGAAGRSGLRPAPASGSSRAPASPPCSSVILACIAGPDPAAVWSCSTGSCGSSAAAASPR